VYISYMPISQYRLGWSTFMWTFLHFLKKAKLITYKHCCFWSNILFSNRYFL